LNEKVLAESHNALHLLRLPGWTSPIEAEIDRILRETITDPVGPEFMAPPVRSVAA
jgi:hypothetical protein